MDKIKKILKKVIGKFKWIIKEKIPVFFESHFLSNKFKKELNKKNIIDVKEFKVHNWHLGYRYYTGFLNGKKVFIKYNRNPKWIMHELENMNYIKENSNFLWNKTPKLILNEINEKYGFVVEEYFEYDSIKKSLQTNKKIDKNKVYEQFIEILLEMQSIQFMHLDINEENLLLSNESDVYFIDMGFSFVKNKENINFIGDKHKTNLILMNLNRDTRLEEGYIDDAISFLEVSKKIEPEFISVYYEKWIKLNSMSEKLYFDYKEILEKNEDKQN